MPNVYQQLCPVLFGAGAADADTTILLLQGVIDKLNGQ